MEEHVGALWHRIITRVAERRYPKAAVRLEEIDKTAGIVFRALGGDGGLRIAAAPSTAHGAHRRLLDRIAGTRLKTELSWLDQETLRLPASIDIFPERALNRDLYLWLVALAAVEGEEGSSWLMRSQRATLAVLARFPGLAARYRRLVEAVLPLRPLPASLPADAAAQEQAIRQALLEPGSVSELPSARHAPYPVHLWLHPQPPASEAAQAGEDAEPPEGGGSGAKRTDRRRHQAERVDMPDNKSPFMLMFRAESILSWAEFTKVNRATDEDDNPDAGSAAQDLDRLSVARDQKTIAARVRFDLDLPSAESDDRPLGEGILLPEWHFRKRILQPRHCRLQPMIARDAPPLALPAHLVGTARKLRRQFEALAPAKVWLDGQFDGSEPDIDAYVQFTADRMNGAARECGLYRNHQYRDRDLACLLLADLSLSTDAWVSDHFRVIDVIRDTLFLFSEALASTGDRFGLYGFSSRKRDNVRFHVLKGFDETYGDVTRGRIAAIKPGFYTRMGAAIRHASQLLAQQPSAQRLLLLLTDGKPNDLDQYEGRYGVEDTREALHAARAMGIRPFCVTIDEEASSYLPHLFGAGGYVVIRKPSELPRELPLLYAQMTR